MEQVANATLAIWLTLAPDEFTRAVEVVQADITTVEGNDLARTAGVETGAQRASGGTTWRCTGRRRTAWKAVLTKGMAVVLAICVPACSPTRSTAAVER
jgi:hypothetical protein